MACRVQLYEFSCSSMDTIANDQNNGTTHMASFARMPPLALRKTVKRNLFGSPEPGSINKEFEDHNLYLRTYVQHRYTIIDDRDIEDKMTHSPNLPHLIEEEMKNYQEKLKRKKCNPITPANEVSGDSGNDDYEYDDDNDNDEDDEDSLTPPSQIKRISSEALLAENAGNLIANSRSCVSTCDRAKRIMKQREITDCFKLRKTVREARTPLLTNSAPVSNGTGNKVLPSAAVTKQSMKPQQRLQSIEKWCREGGGRSETLSLEIATAVTPTEGPPTPASTPSPVSSSASSSPSSSPSPSLSSSSSSFTSSTSPSANSLRSSTSSSLLSSSSPPLPMSMATKSPPSPTSFSPSPSQ